jgi:GNAT superfamily N-acetyltransferase
MASSKPAFRIRPAATGDLPVLVDFNRRLAQETESTTLDPDVLTRGVRRLLESEALGFYLVAVAGAEVVGQVMVTYEWSDWRNGMIWWFQSVYVRADRRRTGVFRALFARVRELAREDPEVVGLRLYVDNENHSAQEVYRRLGFAEGGYRVLQQIPVVGARQDP